MEWHRQGAEKGCLAVIWAVEAVNGDKGMKCRQSHGSSGGGGGSLAMAPVSSFSGVIEDKIGVTFRRCGKWSRRCVRTAWLSDRKAIGIYIEEVAFQHIADTQQKLCIDACAMEYLVDIRAVAAQLVGEPDDRSVLAAELLLNKLADKNLAHKKKKMVWRIKKGAEPDVLIVCLRHRQAPCPPTIRPPVPTQ